MSDTQQTTAMRETLQYLIATDIPAQHKRILLESMTQALRTQHDTETRVAAVKSATQDWEPHETDMVVKFLEKKIANSWQHADEIAIRLAAELHRDLADVRRKAIELGLGSSVDYRLAKMRVRAVQE